MCPAGVSGWGVLLGMPGYNRVRGVRWPVAFWVTDGREFIVPAPVPGPDGLILRCRVDAADAASEFDIGPYYGEQTAGAVIGRAIREWIRRTGQGIVIAPRALR
jgi:hypothetical protein